MRGTEHVVLPAQRNNLHIAVAAFVLMLVFALLAAFFRYRLKLEHDGVNVNARPSSGHSLAAGPSGESA